MAQTPEERKRKRDHYAQSLGFRNYYALDTHRRNQKARAEGYKSRAAKRYATTSKPLIEEAKKWSTFDRFLGSRKPSEKTAREFLKAFGKYPAKVTERYKKQARELRARLIQDLDDWDWAAWREEYESM